VKFRFVMDESPPGAWYWHLMRSRGRGKSRIRICGGKAQPTEAECRASIAEYKAAVAGAKVAKEKL
jgi:hypothetical protein